MQLKEWIKENRKFFTESDLRFLLKEIFFSSNLPLFEKDIFLDEEKVLYLDEIKHKYTKGLPVAYILGKEEFFGLELKVNPRVLVPRKETELIVEKAIELIREKKFKRILDLGCGSGNIALAIKKILGEKINIFSSDISFDALGVAKTNSFLHHTTIPLVNTNLFNGFKEESFDLIVSNPPYVATSEIDDFLKYEPQQALRAGGYGLSFIKPILARAYLYIRSGGYLVMEIGYNHKQPIEHLLRKIDKYETREWIKDYGGNWRGVILHG
jgi:release factor glutamine methyltransferase